MFDYPKQAELSRALPKNKIYEFARPSRAIRSRFVSQIADIVWKYKLSPETVNLPPRQGIEEIQVFVISLKTRELTAAALRPILLTIDKSIPSPIFFQIIFAGRVKFTAAWKRTGEPCPAADGVRKAAPDLYFETPWQPATLPLPPLPVAVDLAGLYDQMLRRHMPLAPRAGESLQEHVWRAGQIRLKEAECRRLDAQLRKERQFNRKVEINAVLRRSTADLAQLRES
jgi:hypothetical protein